MPHLNPHGKGLWF